MLSGPAGTIHFISFDLVMKSLTKHCLLLLFLVPFSTLTALSQNLTGIWKGYFVSGHGDQYKLEFQVNHKGTYVATGVSYSYLDVRFYGKATMTGNFLKNSQTLRIREIKTVEVKSLMGGITCIMNYDLTYSRSGREEFLEGTYLGRDEKPLPGDTSYWGDCGGGRVYLRKVTETDFYLEPFLRRNNTATPTPPVKKETPKTNNNPVVKKPPVVNKPVTPKNNNSKTTVTSKPAIDTAAKVVTPPEVKEEPQKKEVVAQPPTPTPNALKTRENALVKTIYVYDENITVKLYDNGIIDDDTISVYLDKKLVLASKRLTEKALTLKLKMDEENKEHELVMVAENLGRIPPNTSLMVIESGSQRHTVQITSTEQKNAVVRFIYQKPK